MDKDVIKLEQEIRMLEAKIDVNNKLIKEVKKNDLCRKLLNILAVVFCLRFTYQLYGVYDNILKAFVVSLITYIIPKGANILFFGTKKKNMDKINNYLSENSDYINRIDNNKKKLYEVSTKSNNYVYDSFRFDKVDNVSNSKMISKHKSKILKK